MDFVFKYKNEEIKISKNILTGKIKLFANNTELERLDEKNKPFVINNNKIYIKNNGLDLVVPRVLINNEEILLAEKLKWFEIIICFFPLPLIIFGGAIGGGLAGLGIVLNLFFIRSGKKRLFNFLKVIINIIIIFIVYFIISLILNNLIKH